MSQESKKLIDAFNRVLHAAGKSLGTAEYHTELQKDAKLVADFFVKAISDKQEAVENKDVKA